MRVVFFYRKPFAFHKSIEAIFDSVSQKMPASVVPVKKVFNWYSKGVLDRIKIVWEARTNQGDINHITGDIHFAAILLHRNKTLITIHDCGMLASSTGIKHFLLRLFWFSLPLKKCRYVAVVSEATKKELLKYTNYPEKDIFVIPVPISGEFIYSPKEFNTQNPLILQIGTVFNKNVERLLEAVKGISCHLYIVGHLGESLIQKLREYNIQYTNVENITEQDMVNAYRQCDMLSFVSTYEGFGMPIVEANTMGRPVITSNLLSMPEVAANAACLVDPFDVNAIRKGILRIIEDGRYREQLIENGLLNCQRFDAQVIASSYFELYQNLQNGN